MKKVVIAILVLCVMIASIFIIRNSMINNVDYSIEKIEEFNYFIYKDEGKYGVIDKLGNIIITAKYEEVIIPNPEKDIFVCQNQENTSILNSDNQELFGEYEEVRPIKLKNVASSLSYEKNTLKYKQDGLYGLIDFKGNVITKNIYTSIENLQPTEGKFLVEKDGKKGVIDLKGNTLVKPKYDIVISDGYYTEDDEYKKSGFIVANKTDEGYRYGYIAYNGKTIIENKFNEINRISKKDKDIFLIVSENGKQGFYKNSKKILEHEYTDIDYDDEMDLLIVQKNKKYGVYTLGRKKYY